MSIAFKYQLGADDPVTFDSQGLDLPRMARANMQPDTAVIDHPGVEWDADPVFAYRADVTIWMIEGEVSTRVFRGLRRLAPRFLGATAESISYTFEGPWGWLQRRLLLQNAAVPPSEGEGPPVMVPQGLVILGQDDSGATVNLAQALGVIIDAAIADGVPITRGNITGFDFASGWDWMRDVTLADAITRLLQVAPDAVVEWDYSTPNPTIHIRRRVDLDVVTLAIAPARTPVAEFGPGGYAEFESVRIVDRPDLVVPGVWLAFRAINTSNGVPRLQIITEEVTAPGAEKTDENAFVRTVELAGSSSTTNTLEQECVTALIPSALGPGTLTPADAGFGAVLSFLARGEGWLTNPGTTITKLTATGTHSVNSMFRRGLAPDEDTGEMIEVLADTSLVRELVEGAIASWMEESGLNRKAQEQEVCYFVEGTRTIDGAVVPVKATVTRGFLATNASTRIYSIEGSSDFTPGEPKPDGLAATLYAAMSVVQYEGSFTLAQEECTLQLRPGQVINLTGGRAEWTTMKAMVQNVTYNLPDGRTQVTLGFNRTLGANDLVAIWRSNRSRQPAQRGLMRTTGRF